MNSTLRNVRRAVFCWLLLPVFVASAAPPLLSEFMAENKSVLADQDGEFSDWIEIFNSGPGALDLGGYCLTDERDFPSKWRFPAGVVLPEGRFRIVFASGKDRTNATSELHANFQLSKAGEYLALVAQDGRTVLQSFDPYPPQQENVSFGPARVLETQALVHSNTLVRALVPAGAQLGLTWTGGQEPFDDSAWLGGRQGAGYDTGTGAASALSNKLASSSFAFRCEMDLPPNNQDLDGNSADDFSDAGAAPVGGGVAIGTSSLRFEANTGTHLWQAQFSTNFTAEFRLQVLTSVAEGTQGTLSLTASKGSSVAPWLNIRRAGQTWGSAGSTVLGAQDNTDTFHLFRIARQGGDCWVWRDNLLLNPGGLPLAPNTAIAAGNNYFSLGDNAGTGNNGAWWLDFLRLQPGAFAPEVEANLFGGRIRTDLREAMSGVNASAYARLRFVLPGAPSEFSNLVLRVCYDDGFVAYLNGVEAARRNAPASPSWNSASQTNRADALALTAETLDLSAFVPVLASGTNVLAFHALNSEAAASRFLLAAELEGARLHQMGVYFDQPTPGATNTGGAPPQLPKVDFSASSQLFSGSLTLSLGNAFPEAAIYYSTNGSVPAAGAAVLYTGPLTVANTLRVRARAFLGGWSPSPVRSENYVKVGTDLRGFTSPLPVVVLHNFGAGAVPGVSGQGPNGDGSQVVQVALQPQALAVLDRDANGVTTFTNPIAAASRAGLRIHGSTAFNNTKKSYTLETWGETDTVDQDVSLLGMPAESDWVLYGPSWKYPSGGTDYDAALIHNSFIYALANASGYYAPRTRFVELFLNTSGGPITLADYAGLFILTEKVKRADGRTEFPEMSADGAQGGWMINCDRMDSLPPGSYPGSLTPRHFHTAGPDRILQTADDNSRGFKGIRYDVYGGATTDGKGLAPARDDMPNYYHSFFNFESPDGWDITVAQRAKIEGFMRSLDQTLYGPGYTDPLTGYAAYLDVDNWVHHFILQNFPKNQDAEILSAHFVRESPTAKLKHGPIWDFDRAYYKNPSNGSATSDLEWVRPRLYYLRLFTDSEFAQAYTDKWQKLRRASFSDSNLLALVDRQVNEIAPGGTNNTALAREGMTDWPARIATFKTWLTTRGAAIDAQFLKMPIFGKEGGAVDNGFVVTLNNPNAGGAIFFTLDGSDPRARGGGVAGTAQSWPRTIVINSTTVVRARALNGRNWSGLAEAIFYPPQDLSRLALTEIMYHPPDVGATNGDAFEFIELKNTGAITLNLTGLRFTAGIDFGFTNGTLLRPGGFFVIVRDTNGFAAKYPGIPSGGVYTGKLDNAGETLTLGTALGAPVFSVSYDDSEPWPFTPDGFGFSLVRRNPDASQAPDSGARWRASTNPGGSPGADDPPPVIPPVVINELLTHPVPPLTDAIELYNPTDTPADVSGWFLSDDANLPRKFRIPDHTVIASNSFVVFDESDFNLTPGTNLSFALSSLGETVYLASANAGGNLTGYSHGARFGTAARDVSFGRHVNSAGEEHWPAQLARRLGGANSGPRVGPVVISEIFYHPPTGGVEFVEVANISVEPVRLYDQAFPTNTWRVDGANFAFPAGVTLPAGGFAIVAATNEAAFRALYAVPTNVPVFGPMGGALQDSGEDLSLERPDSPLTNGVIPYIAVDAVRYNDHAPWPPAADGAGSSLQRLDLAAYGNEPLNWAAAAPTPGTPLSGNPDRDGDSLPNEWELANGLDPDNPTDAALDSDGDGLSNLEEYLAGTSPQSASSALRLFILPDTAGPRLVFTAVAGRSYAVQANALLDATGWTNVFTLPAPFVTQPCEWTDPNASGQKFYRLVTPNP